MHLQSLILSAAHQVVARRPFRGRGVLERAAMRLARGTTNPVWIKPGFWMEIDLEDDYERAIFTGAYEAPLLHVIRCVLRPGDLFIDGGTNIGVHMLTAAACAGQTGKVLAFEPDEEAFERARTNLNLNPALGPRVHLKRAALGDQPGTVSLLSSGHRHVESRVADSGRPVDCTTLDAELTAREVGADRIVVCKLDVEGYEQRVLDGAVTLLALPESIVICELNDPLLRSNGSSAQELISRLRHQGYAAWTLFGEELIDYDPSWAPWATAVFARGGRAAQRLRSGFWAS
jgi:FkbM family methyltransferase